MLKAERQIPETIHLNKESILDLNEKRAHEYKISPEKHIYDLSGAMSSLDPVFTIKDQFKEILKQHNFEGDYQQCMLLILWIL